MPRALTVEVGSGRSGDSQENKNTRTRVLQLSGRQNGSRVDGVFATVDAPADEIDWIYAALRTAFTTPILAGTEAEYAARVLGRFNRSGVSIVLAIWLNRQVLVGSYQARQAYLCSRDECQDVFGLARPVLVDHTERIARLTLSEGDSLVLVNAAVAQHVTPSELLAVLGTGDSGANSTRDAAQSLAERVSERGGEAAALVLRFKAQRGVARLRQLHAARPRRRVAVRGSAAMVLAVVLLSLTALAALALKGHPVGGHRAAKPRSVARAPTVQRPTVTPTAVPGHRIAASRPPTATPVPPTATSTATPASTATPTQTPRAASAASTAVPTRGTATATATPRPPTVVPTPPRAKPRRPAGPPPAPTPTGLIARQVAASQVVLSWRSIPHATAYVVRIGGKRYFSHVPSLTLAGVLQPARDYAWTVRGVLQNRLGPKSRRVTLHLQAIPARRWRFAPLSRTADTVYLTLYNPNQFDVDVSVQGAKSGSDTPLHIGAGQSTRADLPSSGADSAVVQASGPILVRRLVIISGVERSSYGIPQDTEAG